MDRNVGVGLTKPHKPLKSNHSTYDGMRKVKLSTAMKNAHHDEPGFWERWAENF
jgi:hypothetical protein